MTARFSFLDTFFNNKSIGLLPNISKKSVRNREKKLSMIKNLFIHLNKNPLLSFSTDRRIYIICFLWFTMDHDLGMKYVGQVTASQED